MTQATLFFSAFLFLFFACNFLLQKKLKKCARGFFLKKFVKTMRVETYTYTTRIAKKLLAAKLFVKTSRIKTRVHFCFRFPISNNPVSRYYQNGTTSFEFNEVIFSTRKPVMFSPANVNAWVPNA